MPERALRRIVDELTGRAPAGWTRAQLTSTAGRGAVSVSGGYTVPGRPVTSLPASALFMPVNGLADALREARGWERTELEITCRSSSRYALLATGSGVTGCLSRRDGFMAELDAEARPPQPGSGQPAGGAAPAGDPERAVALFRTYLERRAAILGRSEEQAPPATPAALDDAERRLGRRLPEDLRALYLVADGDGVDYDHHYLFGDAWLGLTGMVAAYGILDQVVSSPWELAWDSVVFDADPPDTVRRCGAHPAWLPFASGEDGNYLAVDLSPARDGRPGQVIRIGRDHHEGPAYVADSVTSLLAGLLEQLDREAYEQDDDRLYVARPAPAGPRRVIGELPDRIPGDLQAAHLHAEGPVDLAPLTAAPRLRLLQVGLGFASDLTPVRSLPVEVLRAGVADGGLTPLRGHPHLAALSLGSTDPVDIGDLRTLPGLHGLDLTRAVVRDLSVLGDLPGLRYLALTAPQWSALLDAGAAPPALAAARLADSEASLGEALAWASRLGVDTGEVFRASGNFTVS
ncbi:SMI1/KNR4 family protein [Streptomyces sp. RFCAC02]|uniref:SMI1/KNR4 family protein n=1 Tax=Streptomyces sp. RFCAC02 TaxID=2499143 RepID=UPI00101F53EF|nr:SMI1/KNR4 family protein [Streptomyces sp. RFCAC02]